MSEVYFLLGQGKVDEAKELLIQEQTWNPRDTLLYLIGAGKEDEAIDLIRREKYITGDQTDDPWNQQAYGCERVEEGEGNSTLYYAMKAGSIRIVRALALKETYNGKFCHIFKRDIDLAIELGDEEMHKALTRRVSSMKRGQAYWEENISVTKENIEAAQKLALDVNILAEHNRNLLHIATMDEDLDKMRKAIAMGVDINAQDKFGRSALHIAVDKCNVEAARLLIESGIDKDIFDNCGFTARYYAVRAANNPPLGNKEPYSEIVRLTDLGENE